MTKPLKTIETWSDFQQCWEEVRSVAGAIGLIYALPEIEELGMGNLEGEDAKLALLREKVSFLLHISDGEEVPDEDVVEAAKRILASRTILGDATSLSWKGPGAGGINQQIMWFLANRHQCLTAPPYPRYIAEYLAAMWNHWRYVHDAWTPQPGDQDYRNIDTKVHGDTELVVKALVTWGCAHFICNPGSSNKAVLQKKQALLALPVLEEVLTQKFGYSGKHKKVMDSLVSILYSQKPPSRLDDPKESHQVELVTCLTLFWCRLMDHP